MDHKEFLTDTKKFIQRESKRKRVYCCGVFDMLHVGHVMLFKNLSKYGDVIVGVLNDETVASYKRTPVMTHNERCDAAREAKYVTEVIENCPLDTTDEFIKEHEIDLVGISEEYYENMSDMLRYYSACVDRTNIIEPKLNNELIIIAPRYNGISSSDLIKRIKSRNDL
jgi:cytidyltransferase-like protein